MEAQAAVKRALVLAAAAVAIIAADGWLIAATWHLPYGTGAYCSIGTGTTVGCNPALSTAAQIAAVVVMITSIPLLAALFALLTGFHLRGHIRDSEERMKRHLEERLAEHHKGLAVVSPPRRAAKPNGSSERLATPEERT
jgi:phosphate/sulfate permease